MWGFKSALGHKRSGCDLRVCYALRISGRVSAAQARGVCVGSRLRPVLFIFDPVRNAVLLVAGDKSGRWKEWYAEAIPAAEALYEAYLEGQR